MEDKETIIFGLPGNEQLTDKLVKHLHAQKGEILVRKFPDQETYIQIKSDVKNKRIVIVCTLHSPDQKLVPLYFVSKTCKELGAEQTCLIAPYLAYMRQDIRFQPGEAISSNYFGSLISQFVDSILTVDPHLHRKSCLSEVFSIPNRVVHAADHISDWIKHHIDNPVLIGPDSESEQWVSVVAKNADAPYLILKKVRLGDKNVEVSVPQVENYRNHAPVLVDDIISTARTMIETIGHLKKAGMKPSICIGVHAVFADNAYQNLLNSGVKQVITCNTISHESNGIDISDILARGYSELQKKQQNHEKSAYDRI